MPKTWPSQETQPFINFTRLKTLYKIQNKMWKCKRQWTSYLLKIYWLRKHKLFYYIPPQGNISPTIFASTLKESHFCLSHQTSKISKADSSRKLKEDTNFSWCPLATKFKGTHHLHYFNINIMST